MVRIRADDDLFVCDRYGLVLSDIINGKRYVCRPGVSCGGGGLFTDGFGKEKGISVCLLIVASVLERYALSLPSSTFSFNLPLSSSILA